MFRRHPEWRSAARQAVFALVPALVGAGILGAAGNKPLTVRSGLATTPSSLSPMLDGPVELAVAHAGEAVVGDPAPAAPVVAPAAAVVTVTTASGREPATATVEAGAPTVAAVDPASPVSAGTPTSGPPTSTSSSTSTTQATTTTTSAPAQASRARAPEAEVVPLTNSDRLAAGLGTLSRSACLDSAAAGFAEQMARSGVLAHNSGAGAAIAGCRPDATWGDNVGMSTACNTSALEREWMASPGHRRNILTGAFTVIGVGAWTDDEGACWVQVLFSS